VRLGYFQQLGKLDYGH